MNSIPTDAATVILLRACRQPDVKDIEVLMVQRRRKSSFVGGYYVFPGGVIDPEDYEPGVERFIRGIARERAARIFNDMSRPEKAIGAWLAAIRETFEEVGILLARKKDGSAIDIRSAEECRRFGAYRKALIKGEMKFLQVLEAEDITLDADSLYYFSHWITPVVLPLRYDVRFFAAEAPARQSAVCDGVELTRQIWRRPSLALKDYDAGEIGLILPQIMTLAALSRFKTFAEVVASLQDRPVPANLTEIKLIDGKEVEVMPDGTGREIRPPVY